MTLTLTEWMDEIVRFKFNSREDYMGGYVVYMVEMAKNLSKNMEHF